MGFQYYGGFGTPVMNYVDQPLVYLVVVIVAAIVGVVLFFTFLNEKNEGKFSGIKEKTYNYMNFNRFYAEKIVKFIYVLVAVVLTLLGITQIIMGSFISGIVTVILGNIITRIGAEMVLLFIMLCKKSVSIDKRLSDIEKFYNDGYEDSERYVDDSCENVECTGCNDTRSCSACCNEKETSDFNCND